MAELRVKGTGTLKLFESDNTSSVTIASPASLGADRTITLPDANVTLVSGTMATTNGITEADTWRITANFTGSVDPITTNWERDDSYGYGLLGTGMSESSGIFSFPSTGFWMVTCVGSGNAVGSDDAYPGMFIYYTPDDSDWTAILTNNYNSAPSGNYFSNTNGKILDITDVSNQKVRFRVEAQQSVTRWLGDTNMNQTYAMFVRLGDT
jgi:hypothetical protein